MAVQLQLDPMGSVFVVFRQASQAKSRTFPKSTVTTLSTISEPWTIGFPSSGESVETTFEQLVSWTTSSKDAVKYFSGTATYSKDINVPNDWFRSDRKLVLDLGTVKEIAELSINGKSAGAVLWKPPFQTDVTALLRPGLNKIEVRVTNLWPNRIIGDQQPTVTRKHPFTDIQPYKQDSPLMESGLLGPVRVMAVSTK
jgi:hypothetical protein